MDFLTGKMKPMYFKYLSAAFASALISSIYGVVDMAMGILTMLFNRQILKYALGTVALFGLIWTALAVFAIIL